MKSQGKDRTEKGVKNEKTEKLSLKEEVDKEAQEIEKEVESRDDLDDINVSEDMETSLLIKYRNTNMTRESKRQCTEAGRNAVSFWRLQLCLFLCAGSVITGTGSKSYWKVLWDRIAGMKIYLI